MTRSRQPHFLYRHLDADGVLLYVGITANPEGRETAHRSSAPWRHLIASIEYETHSTRWVAEAHEQYEIQTSVPLYNVHHALDRKAAKARLADLAATNPAPSKAAGGMTPVEQARIDEAVARLVADAPPVSDEALRMLRHDRCPIGQRKSERKDEAA